MLADNVLGWQIVFKISYLPSKLRFSAKYSFFGQSPSPGHYQLTYQPPEGVYLLNNIEINIIINNKININKIKEAEAEHAIELNPRESIYLPVTILTCLYLKYRQTNTFISPFTYLH